jgi:hypothetical protein
MNIKKITFIVCLLVTFSSLKAQSDSIPIPQLNGHQFVINGLISDPFIYTNLNFQMGVGVSAKFDAPPLPIGGFEFNVIGGSNVYANLNVGYTQRINNWASLNFGVNMSGRIGTAPSSILTQGLNSIVGSSFGMKFKLYEGKKSIISSEFQVKNYKVSAIDVLKYIQDIIANDSTADLTQNTNSLFGAIGIQYAYAHNDLLGFYGTAHYTFGDAVTTGESISQFNLGLAVDINLKARTNVPLGASLGFTTRTIPEITLRSSTETILYNFKLLYTGREDIQLGLSIQYFKNQIEIENVTLPKEITSKVTNFAFTMGYFF